MIKITQNAMLAVLSYVRDDKQLSLDLRKQLHDALSEDNPFFLTRCEDLAQLNHIEMDELEMELKKAKMDKVGHKYLGSLGMMAAARPADKRDELRLDAAKPVVVRP